MSLIAWTTSITPPAVNGRDRGLDFVEIEVRQDVIAKEAGQRDVADRLAHVLTQAHGDVCVHESG